MSSENKKETQKYSYSFLYKHTNTTTFSQISEQTHAKKISNFVKTHDRNPSRGASISALIEDLTTGGKYAVLWRSREGIV